jgi:hypothetical protein
MVPIDISSLKNTLSLVAQEMGELRQEYNDKRKLMSKGIRLVKAIEDYEQEVLKSRELIWNG